MLYIYWYKQYLAVPWGCCGSPICTHWDGIGRFKFQTIFYPCHLVVSFVLSQTKKHTWKVSLQYDSTPVPLFEWIQTGNYEEYWNKLHLQLDVPMPFKTFPGAILSFWKLFSQDFFGPRNFFRPSRLGFGVWLHRRSRGPLGCSPTMQSWKVKFGIPELKKGIPILVATVGREYSNIYRHIQYSLEV